MKLKLPIAVAALVACSGALAEIDFDYWKTLGECSGLYLSGDMKSGPDFDSGQRIGELVRKEILKLNSDDAFTAGYFYGRSEEFTLDFYITERKYHADSDGEAHRLKSIIEKGCERL